jgi:hypothetical protein
MSWINSYGELLAKNHKDLMSGNLCSPKDAPLFRISYFVLRISPKGMKGILNSPEGRLISPTARALWKTYCPPCGYTNQYSYLHDGQKYVKTQITFCLSILKILCLRQPGPTAWGSICRAMTAYFVSNNISSPWTILMPHRRCLFLKKQPLDPAKIFV